MLRFCVFQLQKKESEWFPKHVRRLESLWFPTQSIQRLDIGQQLVVYDVRECHLRSSEVKPKIRHEPVVVCSVCYRLRDGPMETVCSLLQRTFSSTTTQAKIQWSTAACIILSHIYLSGPSVWHHLIRRVQRVRVSCRPTKSNQFSRLKSRSRD